MKLFQQLLLIILFSVSFFSNELSAEVTTEPLARLNGYLENLNSFEANFQQQVVSSNGRLMETTSGKFLMKRPNRFRWQITMPYEQTVIADGCSIWSIDNDLEQVTVTDIDERLGNSPIILLSQKNSKLADFFTVEMMQSENELERFLLTPKDSSSIFEFVQLGFNGGILHLIELHDSLGQITIISMSNIRNNPIMGNQAFIYQEQADYDLIDSRSKGSEGD